MPTGQPSVVNTLVTAGGSAGVEINASMLTVKREREREKTSNYKSCVGQEIG